MFPKIAIISKTLIRKTILRIFLLLTVIPVSHFISIKLILLNYLEHNKILKLHALHTKASSIRIQ